MCIILRTYRNPDAIFLRVNTAGISKVSVAESNVSFSLRVLHFIIMSTVRGFLGIDNGTQGLSVIFTDEALNILTVGKGSYEFIKNLSEGCYEQRCQDWDRALSEAMEQVHRQLSPSKLEVLSIGISGQMHGEVLVGSDGEPLDSVRLWCDARNEQEGDELTNAFQTKIPKRATAARFLWTTRNQPSKAAATAHITTPAGWTAYRLTGQFVLGIGDTAGMFPIDPETMNYDEEKLRIFDNIVNNERIPPLKSILPSIRKAGEDAGKLCATGAALLGLYEGIPVAAAEGDQVAALAGSLIGKARRQEISGDLPTGGSTVCRRRQAHQYGVASEWNNVSKHNCQFIRGNVGGPDRCFRICNGKSH